MYEVYISNGCLVTADDSLITFLSCRKPFILINKDIGQESNSFHCYLKRNFVQFFIYTSCPVSLDIGKILNHLLTL